MTWQKWAEQAVEQYVLDHEVRSTILAAIKGHPAPADHGPCPDRLTFRAVSERRPGAKLRALFHDAWPAYRRWYLRDGEAPRPSLDEARTALAHHMPELVPTWEALVRAVDADELGARMLTLYDPPPLVSGCSQAVLPGDPVLVRNYDYDPRLFDAVVLATRFADTRVIGTADQLWGLLDGVNDRGLAASLTFGGRRAVARGFSVPLVIRYVLETCATVEEGVAALRRLPVQAAYNVTLVDRRGAHATVWLAPGEPARVTSEPIATNHQGEVDWPEHARWTRSVERHERLAHLLENGGAGVPDAMLEPPLRSTSFDAGFGTLYTAAYRPADGAVEYRWPGTTWRHSFAAFREETLDVELAAAAA
jgi:predicted choloylglycine hydrolase